MTNWKYLFLTLPKPNPGLHVNPRFWCDVTGLCKPAIHPKQSLFSKNIKNQPNRQDVSLYLYYKITGCKIMGWRWSSVSQSVGQSTILVQAKIAPQLLDGLLWNLDRTLRRSPLETFLKRGGTKLAFYFCRFHSCYKRVSAKEFIFQQ